MDLSINFYFFKLFFIFFIILNYLFGNLQEICKILKLKLKYSKNLKLKPQLKPLSIFECICLTINCKL